MNSIMYSWEELNDDVRKIANWTKAVNFRPDGVVGIVRGGAIPAVILSHAFNCPVYLINYSLRDGKVKDHRTLDQVGISASHGKKFLVVDDIVDSGETIALIKDRLFDTKNNILYTALWYNPNQTKANIHYWTRVVDRSIDDRWVVFPYEV